MGPVLLVGFIYAYIYRTFKDGLMYHCNFLNVQEEKVRLKEIARLEKKEKEREKKEEREKAKEEKKKEKAEKKVAARHGMKANSVQGAVCMDDFR